MSIRWMMRASLLAIAAFASGAACNGNHPTGPELNVGGGYVLVELDGQAFPAALPSFQTCPAPISYGEMFLSPSNVEMTTLYTFAVTIGRACDPLDTRPPEYRQGLAQFSRDGGNWSVDGTRVGFRSNPTLYGKGSYEGIVRRVGTETVTESVLTFALEGHTYTWRRVRPSGQPPEVSSPVVVLDELDRAVNGTGVQFRYRDGVLSGGVINNDRPSAIVGPVGMEVTIHVNPAPGYSLAPGQSGQVRAVVGQAESIVIRLVNNSP
ncbi:MAG: hypothetical protein H0U13_08480 [Gemmatimonadaceae bacterium]|nr:hypothetical protein [Gemmatimonadaceae bacterium]